MIEALGKQEKTKPKGQQSMHKPMHNKRKNNPKHKTTALVVG